MSRIFTLTSLQGRSLAELHTLHRQAQQELVQSAAGSQARRTALANLEAVSLAIARHMAEARP